MIMKRPEPAIGFAAWAKRRISIWGAEGGGRLWVEIGGASLWGTDTVVEVAKKS
jgi:hypothetical protein